MNIITIDAKTWNVKKSQSETITTDFGTGLYNYPDFMGSKLFHNSTASDKYALSFSIPSNQLISFKESIGKIVMSEADAVEHPTYGKLTHLIIEHPTFGAIKGSIIGSIQYNTSNIGDIPCSCVFAIHTPDNRVEKKDIQDENSEALNSIDLETTANFDVELSAQDKSLLSKLAEGLNALYTNIQNSAVVSTFNDLNTELNAAILDSKRVMNAFKKIIILPGSLLTDTKSKLDILQLQAAVLKTTPVNSYNIALFNANALSYNMGVTTQTAFVSEAALAAASGIKTVPLS